MKKGLQSSERGSTTLPTLAMSLIPGIKLWESLDSELHLQCGLRVILSKLQCLVLKHSAILTKLTKLDRGHRYVTLKLYTLDEVNQEEFQVYNQLNQGNSSHPGYPHVRTAIDMFSIPRPGVNNIHHHCLVQKPMWESFRDLLYRNPTHRFTEELLKAGLLQVFLALDYVHTECKLVHTDIKSDNILQEIEDTSILDKFTQAEMEHPSPRKFIDGNPIYASRRLELPKRFGRAVLSDFGSAVPGDTPSRYHDAQPNVYRSPEVMLKVDWSYPVDIWNVGVMVFSVLFQTSNELLIDIGVGPLRRQTHVLRQ